MFAPVFPTAQLHPYNKYERHSYDCSGHRRFCQVFSLYPPSFPRRTAKNGCLLASSKLPFRRTDLSLCQSLAARAAMPSPCETAPSRALGDDTGAEFHLCTFESGHQKVRPECDLRVRTRTRLTGNGREDV